MKDSIHAVTLGALITCSAIVAAGCSKAARVAAAVEKANGYYTAGELDKAEIEYKNALLKDPANPVAMARLGVLYHEQGREARALPYLLRAKELAPDDVDVRLKLGLIFLGGGNAKAALEEANFIVQNAPNHADGPSLLVEASVRAGADATAVETVRQQLLKLPATAHVLSALANMEMRRNNIEAAKSLLVRATEADPKWAGAHAAAGILHWSQKDLASADAAFKRAAELAPQRSPRRLQYAQFKIQTGDRASGKQLLEEITRATPDYVPAWMWLAELALAENKTEESEAFVAKVLMRDGLHPEALLLNAKIKFAKGEFDKAATELEKIHLTYPNSVPVAYQLGLAYAAKGDLTKASATLSQVVAAAPELHDAALALAEVHVRNKEFIAAIALLKQFTKQKPELVRGWALLADAHRGNGDLPEAERLLRKIEELRPKDAQVIYSHALVLMQQGKAADARNTLTRVLELVPNYLPAIDLLVDLDIREKQFAAARRRVDAEIQKNPNAAEPQLLLAKVLGAQGDASGAEIALKRAIELQPDAITAHMLLARLYVSTRQQAKALNSLQQVVAKDPSSHGALLLTAVIHHEQKDYAAARDAYEKVIAADPKNSVALNNLAYLYSEHFNRLDDALSTAQRARAVLPDDPRTADTLGWILQKRKQYAQAVPLLQESAAKLASEAVVQYHLGVALYSVGDTGGAQAALERALALQPEFDGATDAQTRLSLLKLGVATRNDRSRLEKHVADNPGDPVAQLLLADLYVREGDESKALSAYNAVLQENPRNAKALFGLARLYTTRSDYAKAAEYAKNARNIAPNDTEITHLVGRLAHLMGDYRRGSSILQELSRANPDSAEILFDWAEAAHSVGRVDDAELAAKRALQIAPASERASGARALLEFIALSAEPAKAADALSKLEAAARGGSSPAAMFALAVAREHKRDTAGAQSVYEQLIARCPDFAPAQRNLLLLYAARPADGAKASSLASKVRQAYPSDAMVTRASGIIAFRTGEFGKAAIWLQESLNRHPSDAEALYYLGMAQWRLNKRADGKQSLEKALALGLADELAREARKNLGGTE